MPHRQQSVSAPRGRGKAAAAPKKASVTSESSTSAHFYARPLQESGSTDASSSKGMFVIPQEQAAAVSPTSPGSLITPGSAMPGLSSPLPPPAPGAVNLSAMQHSSSTKTTTTSLSPHPISASPGLSSMATLGGEFGIPKFSPGIAPTKSDGISPSRKSLLSGGVGSSGGRSGGKSGVGGGLSHRPGGGRTKRQHSSATTTTTTIKFHPDRVVSTTLISSSSAPVSTGNSAVRSSAGPSPAPGVRQRVASLTTPSDCDDNGMSHLANGAPMTMGSVKTPTTSPRGHVVLNAIEQRRRTEKRKEKDDDDEEHVPSFTITGTSLTPDDGSYSGIPDVEDFAAATSGPPQTAGVKRPLSSFVDRLATICSDGSGADFEDDDDDDEDDCDYDEDDDVDYDDDDEEEEDEDHGPRVCTAATRECSITPARNLAPPPAVGPGTSSAGPDKGKVVGQCLHCSVPLSALRNSTSNGQSNGSSKGNQPSNAGIQVKCDNCNAFICDTCHWCHEFQANHEIRVCDRCDAFYCRNCDEMDQCEDCSEVVCGGCSTLLSCKFCGCGLCEDCATSCGRCSIVLCARDAKFAVECDTCKMSYCLVCLASNTKDPCVRCGQRPSKRVDRLVHLRLKSIYKAFKQSGAALGNGGNGGSSRAINGPSEPATRGISNGSVSHQDDGKALQPNTTSHIGQCQNATSNMSQCAGSKGGSRSRDNLGTEVLHAAAAADALQSHRRRNGGNKPFDSNPVEEVWRQSKRTGAPPPPPPSSRQSTARGRPCDEAMFSEAGARFSNASFPPPSGARSGRHPLGSSFYDSAAAAAAHGRRVSEPSDRPSETQRLASKTQAEADAAAEALLAELDKERKQSEATSKSKKSKKRRQKERQKAKATGDVTTASASTQRVGSIEAAPSNGEGRHVEDEQFHGDENGYHDEEEGEEVSHAADDGHKVGDKQPALSEVVHVDVNVPAILKDRRRQNGESEEKTASDVPEPKMMAELPDESNDLRKEDGSPDREEERLEALIAEKNYFEIEAMVESLRGVPGRGLLRKHAKKALKRLKEERRPAVELSLEAAAAAAVVAASSGPSPSATGAATGIAEGRKNGRNVSTASLDVGARSTMLKSGIFNGVVMKSNGGGGANQMMYSGAPKKSLHALTMATSAAAAAAQQQQKQQHVQQTHARGRERGRKGDRDRDRVAENGGDGVQDHTPRKLEDSMERTPYKPPEPLLKIVSDTQRPVPVTAAKDGVIVDTEHTRVGVASGGNGYLRTECVMHMAPSVVGWVIGKGGQRIKDLMEETGAKVWIDQETMTTEDMRIVYVSGTRKSVDGAVRMVKELVAKAPVGGTSSSTASSLADTAGCQTGSSDPSGHSAVAAGGVLGDDYGRPTGPEYPTEAMLPMSLEVPTSSVTAQQKGPSLSRRSSSSTISSTPPKRDNRVDSATTTPPAHPLVPLPVMGSTMQRSNTYPSGVGGNGGRNLPPSSLVTQELNCEPRFVPLLIGRRGWTVKHIQDVSGARVDIDQTVTPRRIIVSGNMAQVNNAVRMVRDVLSYPHAQLHHSAGVDSGDSTRPLHHTPSMSNGVAVSHTRGQYRSQYDESVQGSMPTVPQPLRPMLMERTEAYERPMTALLPQNSSVPGPVPVAVRGQHPLDRSGMQSQMGLKGGHHPSMTSFPPMMQRSYHHGGTDGAMHTERPQAYHQRSVAYGQGSMSPPGIVHPGDRQTDHGMAPHYQDRRGMAGGHGSHSIHNVHGPPYISKTHREQAPSHGLDGAAARHDAHLHYSYGSQNGAYGNSYVRNAPTDGYGHQPNREHMHGGAHPLGFGSNGALANNSTMSTTRGTQAALAHVAAMKPFHTRVANGGQHHSTRTVHDHMPSSFSNGTRVQHTDIHGSLPIGSSSSSSSSVVPSYGRIPADATRCSVDNASGSAFARRNEMDGPPGLSHNPGSADGGASLDNGAFRTAMSTRTPPSKAAADENDSDAIDDIIGFKLPTSGVGGGSVLLGDGGDPSDETLLTGLKSLAFGDSVTKTVGNGDAGDSAWSASTIGWTGLGLGGTWSGASEPGSNHGSRVSWPSQGDGAPSLTSDILGASTFDGRANNLQARLFGST